MPSIDPSGLRKASRQKGGKGFHVARSHVTLELGVDIFDEDLAADLLAEEADIAADDRAEIDERRRLAAGQRRQQFSKGFCGEQRFIDWHVDRRTNLRFRSTRCEAV